MTPPGMRKSQRWKHHLHISWTYDPRNHSGGVPWHRLMCGHRNYFFNAGLLQYTAARVIFKTHMMASFALRKKSKLYSWAQGILSLPVWSDLILCLTFLHFSLPAKQLLRNPSTSSLWGSLHLDILPDFCMTNSHHPGVQCSKRPPWLYLNHVPSHSISTHCFIIFHY